MNAVLNHCDENSPYLLKNEAAYQAWRSCKLENRLQAAPLRVFTLNAQGLLADSQLADLQQQVEGYNFIVFEVSDADFRSGWLRTQRQTAGSRRTRLSLRQQVATRA